MTDLAKHFTRFERYREIIAQLAKPKDFYVRFKIKGSDEVLESILSADHYKFVVPSMIMKVSGIESIEVYADKEYTNPLERVKVCDLLVTN